MAEVLLQKDMKVTINNEGVATLIAGSGEFCFIQIHPSDLAKVVRFLVRNGYDFRAPWYEEKGGGL